jgi:predicted hydrocarbon binding protein
MIDLVAQPLVAIPAAALAQLREAVMRDGGDPAPVQEAGYVAGEGLYDAFAASLRARGLPAPETMEFSAAQTEATNFFRDTGWGKVRFEPMATVVAIDAAAWREADPAAGIAHPGCFFGTGLLAGFFGRLADAPLAALEVECRSMGAPRCRFLLGSAESLETVYEEMAASGDYRAAVAG